MTDWTTILTAVGASGVTGLVGYYTAKRNAEMSARAIEAENNRLRTQIEADAEKLREEHRDVHLRTRRDAYVDFLEAERGLRGRVISGRIESGDFDRFHRIAMTVEVFGARDVRDLVRQLVHVWGQFMPEWAERVGAGDDPVASGRATAGKHDPAMNEIRGNLYEAMRADVAPDV